MREQKCRLIDDDVIIGLVDHFESRRVILRRNKCHVGLGDASHSGFDLWKRGRDDRLFVSFSRPTTAISNVPRGNDRVCSLRDYDRRSLQQVFAARKSALASRCVAAIYFPLLIAGGVRLAFGCSPFPHLVGLSWSIHSLHRQNGSPGRTCGGQTWGHGLDLPGKTALPNPLLRTYRSCVLDLKD